MELQVPRSPRYSLQVIPPELQSDYAPHAGGGGDRLGFLPGTRPIPAINLPPTLPDLEHFAASSAMSGCASPWESSV